MRTSWSSRKSSARFGRGSPPTRRRWRLLLVPAVCTGLLVGFGPAAGASAGASAAAKTAGGVDHPTQTTGSASLYGTSAPLPPGAAASPHAAPARDSGVAHMLTRDPRMNRAAQALRPPSPPGTPVVSNPGGAAGFNGITHADQRNAGT